MERNRIPPNTPLSEMEYEGSTAAHIQNWLLPLVSGTRSSLLLRRALSPSWGLIRLDLSMAFLRGQRPAK